jgi:hypothetical protein
MFLRLSLVKGNRSIHSNIKSYYTKFELLNKNLLCIMLHVRISSETIRHTDVAFFVMYL